MSVSVDGSPDLLLAVAGGDNFAQRLQDLIQAKRDSSAALDALNLGRSAKDYMAAAEARMTEAAGMEGRAKEQADAILAEANQKADAIKAEAEESVARKFSALQADITAARAEFDKWQADMNAATKANNDRASELLAQAMDKNAAADAALSNAAALKMEAERRETEAQRVLADAQAAKANYEAMAARVKAAVE